MKQLLTLLIALSMTSTAYASTLNVAQGGTGVGQPNGFSPNSILISGASIFAPFVASTSPTIGYITATSTTATSLFSGNVTVTGILKAGTLTVTGLVSGDLDMGGFQLKDAGTITGTNFSATSTTATSTLSTGGLAVGTNQFVVQQTSGNVGIGTINPGYLLESASTGNKNLAATSWNTAGATGASLLLGRSRSSAIGTQGNVIAGDRLGTINFGGTSANVNFETAGQIAVDADAITSGHTLGRLVFSTNATGGALTERMRIDSVGNVGIGRTAPATTLDVNGISTFRNYLDIGPSQGFVTWNGSKANTFNLTGQSGIGLSLGSNGIHDRLYMDTSGNVGIGTTTPATPLDVNGVIMSEGGTGTFRLGVSNGSQGQWTLSGGDTYFDFLGTEHIRSLTGGTTERMTLLSGGNVGIGTTIPNQLLDVFGGNVSIGDISGLTRGLFLGPKSAQASILYNTNGNLDITPRSGFSSIFTAGNVGIGTTTPAATLDVGGKAGTNPFNISTTTTTAASSTLFRIDTAGDVHYGGGTPTLSSCGTGPTLNSNSTDQSGKVTFGATAAGCTITFSQPKASIPNCIVSTEAVSLVNAYTAVDTVNSLTITQSASGGVTFDYFCPLGH